MGQASIRGALQTKLEGVSGINDVFHGLPISTPPTPYAWYEITLRGQERQTSGAGGNVLMYYTADVHIVVGDQNIAEDDAREIAEPFPSRVRAAFWQDEELGGAVFQCIPAPQQSVDTLSTYKEIEDVWPEIVVRLNITDIEAANAAGG